MNTAMNHHDNYLVWNEQAPHLTALDARTRLNWSIFPLDAGKQPPIIPDKFKDGGEPMRLGWKKYQSKLAHPNQIGAWARQFHPTAWAIITGSLSGRIVLDFDGEQGQRTLGQLGLNPHVRTGSGGHHVHFVHPGWRVKTLNHESDEELGRRWPGMDIRGDGGYAAFCGSNAHGQYIWLRDTDPYSLNILPESLRDYLGLLHAPQSPAPIKLVTPVATPSPSKHRQPAKSLADVILDKYVDKAYSIGRDNACFEMACQLRDNNFSRSEAESIARSFASRVPCTNTKGQHEPFTEQEALVKVASAYGGTAREAWEPLRTDQASYSSNGNGQGNNNHNTDEQKPASFNCTDLGNAERFAARYRDKVRWCEVWNTWLVFNNKCWEPDKSGRVDQLAKATIRAIYHEAAEEPDDMRRKQLAKHAAASESNRAVRAMLDRAKSELPAIPDDFNKHLYLLNCANGTLDLQTGELRPHDPHDMLTRCIKVNYNPLAWSERWDNFMKKFFDGDADLIKFMRQALGMSLCGDTSEQCLFICHGMGSNGKTTMLETVRVIMGSYACAANIETFQVRKNETIGNDIAELYGARMVTASETKLGGRLNEAFVKKATGKEPLRARRLHENEFEFMPEFTLWLAVNHKPVVLDTSKGMWRRVHFIPFNVTIDGDQVDKHFGDKLLEEDEGILASLVQGCMEWIQQGYLSVPQIVQEATAGYRAEMDIVANFLNDECNVGEGKKVTTKNLIARFEAWCGHNSEKFDAKILKNSLKERGYHSQRGHGGSYYWQGFELKPDATNAEKDLWRPKGEGMGEGTFSNLSSKGELGERGEVKNQVKLKSKNPPDATLNSRSPRSPRSPIELKFEENGEGTFTQEEKEADVTDNLQSVTQNDQSDEIDRELFTNLLTRLDTLVPANEHVIWNQDGEKPEMRYSAYRCRLVSLAQTDMAAALKSVRAKVAHYNVRQ